MKASIHRSAGFEVHDQHEPETAFHDFDVTRHVDKRINILKEEVAYLIMSEPADRVLIYD